eukprot:3979093-Ditylum_brightwellii.AAC.1
MLVTNLKDRMEVTILSDLGHDIKVFSIWFTDKRNAIVREVGTSEYTKYKKCVFQTYQTAENEELFTAINQGYTRNGKGN